ncbi:hypothetical protein HN51_018534 [Arachis hypogaea]
MGYFSAAAPGTGILTRGIFSTPSYPEKAGTPCVLEPITIFRLMSRRLILQQACG